MFLKDFAIESANFYLKDALCRNILLADLLGSQYLLEILQTSLTVKNNENGLKSGCFEKRLTFTKTILERPYKVLQSSQEVQSVQF